MILSNVKSYEEGFLSDGYHYASVITIDSDVIASCTQEPIIHTIYEEYWEKERVLLFGMVPWGYKHVRKTKDVGERGYFFHTLKNGERLVSDENLLERVKNKK